MTASTDTRPEPPFSGSEKDMLLGFLRFLRETIVWKLDGLSEDDARRTLAPSTMSLISMAQHLMYVERYWFQGVFLDRDIEFGWSKEDPDGDWRVPDGLSVTDVIAAYRAECALSDEIVATASPEDVAAYDDPRRPGLQLRWILTHMIEETGRHCGHADLIRESIDGATGE